MPGMCWGDEMIDGQTTTLDPRGAVWRLACVRAAMEYANAAALLRAMLDAVGMQAIGVTVDDEFMYTDGDGPSLRAERRTLDIPAIPGLVSLDTRPYWVVDKPVYQPATRWEPSWTDVVEVSAHLSYAEACRALVLVWVEDRLAGVRENTQPPFPSYGERVYWGWEKEEEDDDER